MIKVRKRRFRGLLLLFHDLIGRSILFHRKLSSLVVRCRRENALSAQIYRSFPKSAKVSAGEAKLSI